MSPPTRFASHWYARPGWSDESRYLTFHLLPQAASVGWAGLAAAVGRDQAALAGVRGLTPVPARWLHLTVQGVGHAAQLPSRSLPQLLERAGRELAGVPPVRLRFPAVAEVHREGVLFTGSPADPVARLRQALRAALSDVLGPAAVPGAGDEPVWPHLSIAYADADTSTAPALAALRPGHGAPAAALEVTFAAVSLIRLRTQGKLYRWELLGDIPLGGRAG